MPTFIEVYWHKAEGKNKAREFMTVIRTQSGGCQNKDSSKTVQAWEVWS